jgi:hypothetical protein
VRLHTRPVISSPCESAASQYRVGLIRFAPGRVLVFHGGVFGCSSRMNGKPSSPVLRGLGASNGARLLDPNRFTSIARQPPRTATISSKRISIGPVIHPSSDSPCEVVCQQHDQIALCRLQESAIRSGSALDGGENDILGESVTRELSRNGFGEN